MVTVKDVDCQKYNKADQFTFVKKMGKTKTALVFVLSFICMLMMGYLSSRDFSDPKMNWIGEIVNVIGMTMLWAGIRSLHRDGLETFEMKR